MKVKVDIFSGFLGAGKTRLIKKMLQENYYNEKVAIVENEFGEVSIDGAILSDTEAIITEINAGCICCQITGDFKEAIINIIDNYPVKKLLIEPTGIAKLSEIKKTFQAKELVDRLEIDKVITVVDSERFYKYLKNFRSFFIDQIKATDLVVLSRTQNVEEEYLNTLVKDINKLNRNVEIIDKCWNTESALNLIPKDINLKVTDKNRNKLKLGKVIEIHKENENEFQTFAINLERLVSENELISKFKFISSSKNFGEVIRAKGIVKNNNNEMKQFDFALDEFSIESVNYNGEAIISFIGLNLNKDEITSFFK